MMYTILFLDIISLLIKRSSLIFLYPLLIIIVVIIVIGFNSVIYKYKDPENSVKSEKFNIPQNQFIHEYTMISSKKYEDYISKMSNDVDMVLNEVKNFRKLMQKYEKYAGLASSSTGRRRQRFIKRAEYYSVQVIESYERLKNIKMDIINEEAFEEWRQRVYH
ncbi:hypothetical protein [Acidiplasma sp.]|jgi:hypothetical protein|nr:hypothetical protein [Acidiplasma sp.]